MSANGGDPVRPEFPVAFLRALRAIELHPHVKRVEVDQTTTDRETISVDVDVLTHFPSRWCGESPGGVREIETVTIAFPASYPLDKPRPFLRDDFPPDHPHLQPGSSVRPEACLIDGDVSEVIQAGGGILIFVDQLVSWLDKAARLDLIDLSHGWEPVRRDNLDDIFTLDESGARGFAARDSGAAFLGAVALRALQKNAPYGVSIDARERIPLNADFSKTTRLMQAPRHKDHVHRQTAAIICWAGGGRDGKLHIDGDYKPENVSTLAGLLERADRFGCRAPLTTRLNLLSKRMTGADFRLPIPVPILLLARRPANLQGVDSSIEIVPYLLEAREPKDLSDPSTPVRIAGIRGAVSRSILRRASGFEEGDAYADWALLGCGSVGSKIAIHLARSGHAPLRLIDADSMQPHNFARHTLLPPHPEVLDPALTRKAGEICFDVATLGGKEARYSLSDVTKINDPGMLKEHFPKAVAFAVNTTGSHVVREAISFIWPRSARPHLRSIEACLMGGGHIGYHTVEGASGNPNTSDLIAEFYHDLRRSEHKGTRQRAYAQGADEIAIGQGCSSRSMTLPDAELSVLTASLAIQTRRMLSAPPPSDGLVSIGEFDFESLSQTWRAFDVPPYTTVSAERNGVEIRVAKRVVDEIDRQVAARPGRETGGILVGRFSQIGNAFQVVDTLPAPPDSRFSRYEFVLGTEGLREALDQLQAETDGKLYALGTWHNHLYPSGPSSTDRNTAEKLALGQLFPVLLLISTPSGFRTLVTETFPDLKDGSPT